MFTVKFVGGAKKSFPEEYVKIDKSDMSIQELIDLLLELKLDDTPKLDTDNALIAINGSDSSAMDGKSTKIKNNDVVSIIPVIHGGASEKITFECAKQQIQVLEIKGQKSIDVKFIDDLRKKYPRLVLQAVSSSFILNNYHLQKIISLSFESKKNGVLLSNKFEIDILMRFALTTQISSAIKQVGIKPKDNFILIAIGNKKILNLLYRELLPMTEILFSKNPSLYLKRHFKITKKHVNSIHSKTPLEDILVEKAAILF
ncbi:MAG: thiamine biosynthesis protein ThiS [Nitrosopumilus sp.]|nr:MAG: thiamine biosynthesis protein ThiS [Nitrosopumilus sp.]